MLKKRTRNIVGLAKLLNKEVFFDKTYIDDSVACPLTVLRSGKMYEF